MAAIIPEYIKREMHLVAKYAKSATFHMDIVETWLERMGIDTSFTEGLRDGSGCGLEELEYGNDVTDELCERIERLLRIRYRSGVNEKQTIAQNQTRV